MEKEKTPDIKTTIITNNEGIIAEIPAGTYFISKEGSPALSENLIFPGWKIHKKLNGVFFPLKDFGYTVLDECIDECKRLNEGKEYETK